MIKKNKLESLVLLAFEAKPAFSKVRLNKVLYYFDSFWYAANNTTFTECEYSAKDMGPVCDGLNEALDCLVKEDLLVEEEVSASWRTQPYFSYRLSKKGEKKASSTMTKTKEERGAKGFFLSLVQKASSPQQERIVEQSHNRAWEVAYTTGQKLNFENNDWLE